MLIQEHEGGSNMAKLYFRYGAMNCGKTTALLQVAHNYEERDQNVIIIKSLIDTKGGDNIVSRIGLERKVDELIGPDESLYEKYDYYIEMIYGGIWLIFTKDDFFYTKLIANFKCKMIRPDFHEGHERDKD